MGDVFHDLHGVGLERRHEHLALGVAEADVELDDLGAGRGHHDADVKRAAVIDAVGFQAAQRGRDDLLAETAFDLGRDDGGGGISTHAAGIEAGIAFADALMVLARREHEVFVAADHEHDRRLFALHEFLDDDFVPGRTEDLGLHHVAQRGLGFGVRGRDDDALPRRQAGGLDDDGDGLLAHVIQGGREGTEGLRGGGGHLMAHHEILAEGLAGFEARTRGERTVGRDARGFEGVDHAGGEGDFRPDDHEGGGRATDEFQDGGRVGGVDVEALGFEGHAAVTGGDADLGHAGAAEAGLEQSVFPAAGAEDEDVEFSLRSHSLLLRGVGFDVNQKQGRPVSGPTQPKLVLRPGLEPGHLAAHAPQACVSAIPPPEQ